MNYLLLVFRFFSPSQNPSLVAKLRVLDNFSGIAVFFIGTISKCFNKLTTTAFISRRANLDPGRDELLNKTSILNQTYQYNYGDHFQTA